MHLVKSGCMAGYLTGAKAEISSATAEANSKMPNRRRGIVCLSKMKAPDLVGELSRKIPKSITLTGVRSTHIRQRRGIAGQQFYPEFVDHPHARRSRLWRLMGSSDSSPSVL
jgi:hypothetical protein